MSPFSLPLASRPLAWAKDNRFEPGETHFSSVVPVYALWIMLKGEAQIETEGQIWTIRAGEIWLGAPCRARRVSTRQGAHWLSLGLGEIGIAQMSESRILRANEAERARLETLLHLLIEEPAGDLVDGLVRALVALVRRIAGENRELPAWANAVWTKIEADPHCRVEELARLAHFSPAQFRRVFARQFGMPPRDFLMRRRLEGAREQLENSELAVAQIARDCGFGGASQLAREFKRTFGLTPLQWRIVARENLV